MTFQELIEVWIFDAVDKFTTVFMTIALLFFFWGIATVILNAGDEAAAKTGKQRMLWGTIAIVVMFSLWGIVRLIQSSLFGETT